MARGINKGPSRKDLKTRDRISTTLRLDLISDLNQLSRDTRIDKSKLHDEAIEDLLMKYKKQGRLK